MSSVLSPFNGPYFNIHTVIYIDIYENLRPT